MRSIQSRTRTVLWALYAFGLFAGAAAVAEGFEAVALHRSQSGIDATPGFLTLTDAIWSVSYLGYLAAFFVFGIAFLLWFHASHKRLRDRGLEPRYGSGWAIGGFFVPFLNIVRPYQMMKEVWQGSEFLDDGNEEVPWQKLKPGALVGQWWTLVMLSAVAGRFAMRAPLEPESVSELLTSAYVGVMSNLIDLVAIWVTVLLVKKIAGFQATSGNRHGVKPIEPGSVPEFA